MGVGKSDKSALAVRSSMLTSFNNGNEILAYKLTYSCCFSLGTNVAVALATI